MIRKIAESTVPVLGFHDTCVINLRGAKTSWISTNATIRTNRSIQAVALT